MTNPFVSLGCYCEGTQLFLTEAAFVKRRERRGRGAVFSLQSRVPPALVDGGAEEGNTPAGLWKGSWPRRAVFLL